ncbi:MAG: NUDIX hydrolase [Candidatus Bathyarchaeota archaeon]|nr:NUDIX hydrolase [Candidatus Bathyarchaeota archaeon]MDW8041008.1 NUDIX hydrolase [Nitrososphaerota archaeon]
MVKRFYPSQPVVGVGAIIVCDGKILLEKRKGEPGRGKWSVPGGLVELGETVEEAVVREVKEETGLDVADPELIDVVDNIVRDEKGEIKYHFVIIDYLVKVRGGEVRAADDAEELKWIPLSEVEKYDLTKTFRFFLQKNRGKLEKFNSCP